MELHMIPNNPSITNKQPLEDDILWGADEIAEFLFGDRASRRKVYYLAECTKLPIFRLDSVLCARRSVLLNWIAGQESREMFRWTLRGVDFAGTGATACPLCATFPGKMMKRNIEAKVNSDGR
jgi:hypothetical protein